MEYHSLHEKKVTRDGEGATPMIGSTEFMVNPDSQAQRRFVR